MNNSINAFNAEIERCMTILRFNLKHWCEDYVKKEEEKKVLLGLYEKAYSYFTCSKLYFIRMSMRPSKPVDSIVAAAFGNAVGGAALGVISYLEAKEANDAYNKAMATNRDAVSSYETNIGYTIAYYNEIVKRLSEYPEWVKDQEKLKVKYIKKIKEEKKAGVRFMLTNAAIGAIIAIPLGFLLFRILNNINPGSAAVLCAGFLTICMVGIFMAIMGIIQRDKWDKFFLAKQIENNDVYFQKYGFRNIYY